MLGFNKHLILTQKRMKPDLRTTLFIKYQEELNNFGFENYYCLDTNIDLFTPDLNNVMEFGDNL